MSRTSGNTPEGESCTLPRRDEYARSTGADCRGNRGRTDRSNGSDPYTRDDHTGGEQQIHLPEKLSLNHAIARVASRMAGSIPRIPANVVAPN